jgi:hypothetical protein
MGALEDDKDSYNLPVWPACWWTDVRLAPLHWYRGRELLTLELISLKPAIASQSRVFLLNRAAGTGGVKERHEHE